MEVGGKEGLGNWKEKREGEEIHGCFVCAGWILSSQDTITTYNKAKL